MSLGRLTPPKSLGEGLQVTKFNQCLHIVMVIGTFLGDLSIEEFLMVEENFHEGSAGLNTSIIKKKQ